MTKWQQKVDQKLEELEAWLIKNRAWLFADKISCRWFDLIGSGTSSGVDHGTLLGLSDDDHTQYILVDGTRAFTDYMDIDVHAVPAAPVANALRLYAEDIQGFPFFSFIDDTGMRRKIVRDSVFVAKNVTGVEIPANRAVYATGSDTGIPTVAPARANSVNTMPSIGVTLEAIADDGFGRIMQVGLVENVNTDAFSEGDVLYVSSAAAGILVATAPLYPNIRQEVGVILVSDDTVGTVQLIARSMFNEGILDHGGLLGLTDDDHTHMPILAPTASTRNVIQPTGAAVKPMVLKGYTSQSANLLELQNSSAAVTLSATGFDSTTAFQVNKEDTTNVLTVDTSNGRVGIGTATPTAHLEVTTPVFENLSVVFRTAATSRDVSLSLSGSTTGTAAIYLGDNSSIRWYENGDTLRFYNNGEKMRITSAGRVGIGTTSPGAKLQVNTGGAVIGQIIKGGASQSANLQEWQDSNAAVLAYVNKTGGALFSNKVIFTQTDGNEYIDSLADGYLDIAATTAVRMKADVSIDDGKNIVLDTTTGTKIGTAAAQKLGFFNAAPVVQQAHIVDADGTIGDITTKFNTLLGYLETFGLLATS